VGEFTVASIGIYFKQRLQKQAAIPCLAYMYYYIEFPLK